MNDISEIHSIELNRSKPFNHEILIKDKAGWVMERIPVNETAGFEKLQLISFVFPPHF